MTPSKKRVTIPGSQKKALLNAKVTGAVDPDERIEITMVMRPRSGSGPRTTKAAASEAMKSASKLPARRQYLTREAFALERGAVSNPKSGVAEQRHHRVRLPTP